MTSRNQKELQKLLDLLGDDEIELEQTPSQVIEEYWLQKAAINNLKESGEKDEVGFLVAEFLRTHPNFDLPDGRNQHPAVLQIGSIVRRWLYQCYQENITDYWMAAMRSAEIWFDGCPDSLKREWSVFRNAYESECCVNDYNNAGVNEIYNRIRAKWSAKAKAENSPG